MIHKITKADKKRFWSKVNKSGNCWEWIAGLQTSGYGHFWFNYNNITAHRLSYMLCIGPIKNGLCVCHKCNNKKCVNPNHLYLAYHHQNMVDAGKDGLLSGWTRRFPKIKQTRELAG